MVWASVTDGTTVNHVPSVAFSPNQASTVNPVGTAVYSFTLVNGGNGPDTIGLSHHSNRGWPVSVATPVSVGYGQTATVIVSVAVPASKLKLSGVYAPDRAPTSRMSESSRLASITGSLNRAV